MSDNKTTQQRIQAIREEMLHTRECRSYHFHYRKATAQVLQSYRDDLRNSNCN